MRAKKERLPRYDLVIRNGTIYDGSGSTPFIGDLAINNDTIAAIGDMSQVTGKKEINANGLAVAPGFINVMSHAEQSLIADGCSQSDIRQGVTLEVFGESWVGPLNDWMKKDWTDRQNYTKFAIQWSTLGEYLKWLINRGASCNIASFVSLQTIRAHVLGYENRAPTKGELNQMRNLLAQAMEEGALGLASALIYVPDCFAGTDEIIALAQVVSQYGGTYISHIRNEGRHLLESVDELILIASSAKVAAEIYHLKALGRENWPKMDAVIRKIELARNQGLSITANMYPYIGSSTGLNVLMPLWTQEGGEKVWIERLRSPVIRERIKDEMSALSDKWENRLLTEGAHNILLVHFKNESLELFTGKTLAQAALMRKQSPVDTVIDLIIEDNSRVGAVYFMMSKENVRKQIALPWITFCSDSPSVAPQGVFVKSDIHPRAYGAFARLLGKYVRKEKIISLQEAICRLTSLPAANFKLQRRGWLRPGCYADIVVFDPAKVEDRATFDHPHQYAKGVSHVFVNGVSVISDGKHTGAKPGRIVRGPGFKD